MRLPAASTFLLLCVLLSTFAGCKDDLLLTEACSAKLTRCGEICVDPGSDPLHCGGCNLACAEGELCAEGFCTPACPPTRALCEDSCVALFRDPAHCGACGHACPEDQVCSKGECATDCGPGLHPCDRACIDLLGDPENCGACGEACPGDRQCRSGSCLCETGFTDCDGSCVDPRADAGHCGGCDKACAPGERCLDAACACPDGELDCGQGCTDVLANDLNCGACGVHCPPGRSCQDGSCRCEGGRTDCDGDCVDTQTHPRACGSCEIDCIGQDGVERATCAAGTCRFECESGFMDCDPARSGCETPYLTDNQNCGDCGKECPAGESCSSGSCCPPQRIGCNGVCVDWRSDERNCGDCGNDCSQKPYVETATCEDASCALTCKPHYGDCNERPDDGCEAHLLTDPRHCGACGNRCPVGCVGGKCTSGAAIAIGYNHSCFINRQVADGAPAGSVWCWGSNQYGQLGNGSEIDSAYPVRAGSIEDVVQITLQERNTCALEASGRVWCWGYNYAGRNGDGTDTPGNRNAPVQVINLDDAVQISSGFAHVCALRWDSTIACWGSNGSGRLGDGTLVTPRLAPVTVMEDLAAGKVLEGVAQVACGMSNTCARMRNGTVKCWGWGVNGENGNGDYGNDNQNNPQPMDVMLDARTPLTGVIQLSGGGQPGGGFVLALRADGSAMGWGSNNFGTLALGHFTIGPPGNSFGFPYAQRMNLTDAVQLSAGRTHACAKLADGTARCWGNGFAGQVGAGTRPGSFPPSPVVDSDCKTTLQGIAVIGSGGQHSCAEMADGSLRCWGANDRGQLAERIGPTQFSPCALPVP